MVVLSRVYVDQEFVQLLLVRVMKSVQAAVLIHMNLLRSLMNITSEENFHISSNSALQDVRTTVLRQRRMMLVSRALLMLSGLKTNVLAVVYVRRPVVQVQSQCRMARLQLIMTNVITAADALNPVQQMRGMHLLHISFHLQEYLVIL